MLNQRLYQIYMTERTYSASDAKQIDEQILIIHREVTKITNTIEYINKSHKLKNT